MAKITNEVVKATAQQATGLEIKEGETTRDYINRVRIENLSNQSLIKSGLISLNDYDPKVSGLWTNMIWLISKYVLENVSYNTPFYRFVKTMPEGGDIMESFIRLKEAIDRNSVSNSDLFTEYVDIIETAYHRINNQVLFPTDFREDELRKVCASWDTMTARLNQFVSNLETSFQVWVHKKVKQLLYDATQTGQVNGEIFTLSSPTPTRDDWANLAARLNTIKDLMVIEPTTMFSGINLNTLNLTPLENVAASPITIIITAAALRKQEFMNALTLYFGDKGQDSFERNILEIGTVPTVVVDNTFPTGFSGTPVAAGVPFAFIVEEDFFFVYEQLKMNFQFHNAMTLDMKHVLHTDFMTSISPFKMGYYISSPTVITRSNDQSRDVLRNVITDEELFNVIVNEKGEQELWTIPKTRFVKSEFIEKFDPAKWATIQDKRK